MKDEQTRIAWIDCVKAIAIIAVAVDHTNGMIYSNQLIAHASYFSVSLFILISGISIWLRDSRKEITFNHQIIKVKALCLQYAVATIIVLVISEKFFDLKAYISHLLGFSVQSPYYFFVFFMQLILVAPLLLWWRKLCSRCRRRNILHTVTLICLGILSSIFIHYTYILPVHGGGQYLFGGTYLILYYLGMVLASFGIFDKMKSRRKMVFICSLFLWIFWWLMSSYDKLPFDAYMETYWGTGFNPPSIQFMVFAVITLFLLFSLFSLLEEMSWKPIKSVVGFFAHIGRNTLYIFMYHLLVRNIIASYVSIDSHRILRGIAFILMIVVPVLGIDLWRKCKNILNERC